MGPLGRATCTVQTIRAYCFDTVEIGEKCLYRPSFLNAFSVENLAKRKKTIVIVVYLMHIRWLYFVRKHHIIKNRINILLSTSISCSAYRAINTNPEFYEILRHICFDLCVECRHRMRIGI